MKAAEHRAIGDAATAGATVLLGGRSPDGPLRLSFGQVVALSGDYFLPDRSPATAALASGGLFALADVAGNRGAALGSRDEILCALGILATEGGEGSVVWPPWSADVERRVRDRFLALGASNEDHFVAPGGRGGTGYGSAVRAYGALHRQAVEEAGRLGREGGDLGWAMASEAGAQHYLTDAFAAGHLRAPVGAIRQHWQARYPGFWEALRRKVASDTARALREVAPAMRVLRAGHLYDRTLAAVRARTEGYPHVSLGDLIAKVFHDWDNEHGLELVGGGRLFGDGCLERGVTRERAVAAARAGVDEVELAYRRAARSGEGGDALYAAVRDAVQAPPWPQASPDNPPLNWRAPDFDTLWDSPIVGSSGPTVGQAVHQALEEGEELPTRLGCLGSGIAGALDVPAVPFLRNWLNRCACEAYHRGFLAQLIADPRGCVSEVVAASERPLVEPEAFVASV